MKFGLKKLETSLLSYGADVFSILNR